VDQGAEVLGAYQYKQIPEARTAAVMIASAQISVYPLGQDRFGPAIKAMGAALRHTAWLVRFGP